MTNEADKPSVEGLKPCPFCDRRPTFSHFEFGGVEFWVVRCCISETHRERSKSEAAASWNRRASAAAPAALPATPLREVLEAMQWAKKTIHFALNEDRSIGPMLKLDAAIAALRALMERKHEHADIESR